MSACERVEIYLATWWLTAFPTTVRLGQGDDDEPQIAWDPQAAGLRQQPNVLTRPELPPVAGRFSVRDMPVRSVLVCEVVPVLSALVCEVAGG